VLALALTACGSRKAEVCARLHPVLLAQFRAHDELAEHLRGAGPCEAQARRLRALSVSDARLARALRDYLASVEALAEAYGEAARVHRNRPDGAVDVSPLELQALAARLTAHVTTVDSAGLSLLGACQGP
jgi:hypothetical protein